MRVSDESDDIEDDDVGAGIGDGDDDDARADDAARTRLSPISLRMIQ